MKIAFYHHHMPCGGIEQTFINLMGAFLSYGHQIDFLLYNIQGDMIDRVPVDVRIIQVARSGTLRGLLSALLASPSIFLSFPLPFFKRHLQADLVRLPHLKRYLRSESPDVVIAGRPGCCIVAVLAAKNTKVVITDHSPLTWLKHLNGKRVKKKFLSLTGAVYRKAHAIVAVSSYCAETLATCTKLDRRQITIIYNPVVTSDFAQKVDEPIDHPWFAPGAPPVVLFVGRISIHKNLASLVRAYAIVLRNRPARLMILGAGHESDEAEVKTELLPLIDQLRIADSVLLAGFVSNPFPYMARAAVLVVSSTSEAFCNVAAEALACACPVVSTDCGGPSEILDQGKYGRLVPIGDDIALAEAIEHAIQQPADRDLLLARANNFCADRIADDYLKLFVA